MLRKLVNTFELDGKIIDAIEITEIKTGVTEYFKGGLYSNGELVVEVSDWLELPEYQMDEVEVPEDSVII